MQKKSFLDRKISNRLAYTILLVFTVILAGIFVYAADAVVPGDQATPNPGHSISQIGTPAGCSANQFLQWNGNAWVCSNVDGGGGENVWTLSGNNIYYSNGNVGIGTSTPREKLQIGDIFTFHNGGEKVIARNFYYDGQDKRIITGKSSAIYFGDGELKLRVAENGQANSQISWNNALNIDNNGNVGIGTISPSAKLHVNGTGAILNISNQTNSHLFVDGSTGRVGIGTDNPQAKFDVSLGNDNSFSVNNNLPIGLELRSPTTGTPYIDFSNNSVIDFNMRLMLINSDRYPALLIEDRPSGWKVAFRQGGVILNYAPGARMNPKPECNSYNHGMLWAGGLVNEDEILYFCRQRADGQHEWKRVSLE